MVYDHHSLEGGPRAESIRALAPQLDVGEETLRNWSNRYGPAEVASGPQNPLAEENRRLRRKLAEAHWPHWRSRCTQLQSCRPLQTLPLAPTRKRPAVQPVKVRIMVSPPESGVRQPVLHEALRDATARTQIEPKNFPGIQVRSERDCMGARAIAWPPSMHRSRATRRRSETIARNEGWRRPYRSKSSGTRVETILVSLLPGNALSA